MSNLHEDTPGREYTGPEDYGHGPDDTTGQDGSTAQYGPVDTTETTGQYGSTAQYGPEPTGGPEQRWARGTSWATVAFGLVCMAVAGLALTLQLTDLRVDWEIAGPATVVGLGALLVVVGLVGLLSQRREE